MNSMTRIITRLLVVSLLAFAAACSDTSDKVIYDGDLPTAPVADTPSSDPEPEPGNIIDVATEAGGFSEFLAAAESAGLLDALTDETASLTIFAPTDDAFTALGKIASPSVGAKVALSELSSDELANILLYHVLSGEVSVLGAGELAPTTVETLNGADVAITMRDDDYLYVNMAKVVSYDIEASNGVIHVIEEVLLPPDTSMSDMSIADIVEASGDFDTLETAIVTANMLTDLADEEATFTVFAPTDAAFDELGDAALNYALGNLDLLSNTLSYHLVAGAELYSSDAIVAAAAGSKVAMANGDESTFALDYAGVMINDANIVTTDIVASNGVIHVIDMVMDAPSSEPPPIAITLAAEGSFTTLVDLVAEADLTDALMDPSANLTVFAPTDDAFALIPGEDLAALRADTDALASALQYHLYPDTIAAADLALLAGTPLSMATGDTADISTTSDGGVKINDANVITADIAANNGIIHAINRVIFPSEDGEEPGSPLLGRWKISSEPYS
ncbi:MAG TPA: adhesion lipoprotein, partial [Halieaceae bacterium]|nr:adhesion lipoprotein [Halieaceae bacterium]